MKRLFALVFLTAAVHAQPTVVTPQSTNPVVALNAVSVPTASGPVLNVGQNIHFVNYTTTSTFLVAIQLEGSFDCVTYFQIGDQGTNPSGGTISASGYYPCVQAHLVRLSGTGTPTVTATYVGTSSTIPLSGTAANAAGINHQTIAYQVAADANLSAVNVNMPATSSAILAVTFSASGCVGSSVTVNAFPGSNNLAPASFNTLYLSSTVGAGYQQFYLGNFVGTNAQVGYSAGSSGCTGKTVTIDLYFLYSQITSYPQGYSPTAVQAVYGAPLLTPAAGLDGSSGTSPFGIVQPMLSCGGDVLNVGVNLANTSITQLVGLTAAEQIRVCAVIFSAAAVADIQFSYGTGANCGTGNTNVGPLLKAVQSSFMGFSPGTILNLPSGQAFCVSQSVSQANGVWVFYTKH